MNELTKILRENKEQAVSELVGSLIGSVPRYALANPGEVRERVERVFEGFLLSIETGDTSEISKTLKEIARQRVEQGFSPADFMSAILMVYPVTRSLVRTAGPRNDTGFAKLFEQVEQAAIRTIAIAANIFTAAVAEKTETQLAAAQETNEALSKQERTLQQVTAEQQRALLQAQDFNARVISSLSSGVLVVEHQTLKIVMWSARLEEILGVSAKDALGRQADVVLDGRFKNNPAKEIITTIRTGGRLPLTKVSLQTNEGPPRHLFVRGERLRGGADGAPTGAVIVVDDITERELLIDSFSRYVSKEVVQQLLSRSGRSNKIAGERRNCTVLFADIRGFTTISERVSLEHLHEMLNQYFRLMINQVTLHDGIIDKFIGDKIMAVFTAGGDDGATAAARAALAIQHEVAALNLSRGEEPITLGIGINTGQVVMGTVGSEERMSFTVIGDSVNVADRLQSMAPPGVSLVGGKTAINLADRFVLQEMGEHMLKGRSNPELVYRLISSKP